MLSSNISLAERPADTLLAKHEARARWHFQSDWKRSGQSFVGGSSVLPQRWAAGPA
jgi:hypothetical protein